MTDDYKSLIQEFKQYTELAIYSVQNEDTNKLNEYISERQIVIDKIKNLHCAKQELNAEFSRNNIDKLQAKLVMSINEKKDAVKLKINKSLNAANVSKNYYSEIQKKAIIFSKKV